MNKNDFRIGNWVQWDGIEPVAYRQIESPTYISGLDAPIPITVEMLDKMGFKSLPHPTIGNVRQIELGNNRFLSVSSAGGGNEMIFISEEFPPEVLSIVVLRNIDYDGRTYVHDIQNIYHSITKKELEFNLY